MMNFEFGANFSDFVHMYLSQQNPRMTKFLPFLSRLMFFLTLMVDLEFGTNLGDFALPTTTKERKTTKKEEDRGWI
jgi:hypothetical protein